MNGVTDKASAANLTQTMIFPKMVGGWIRTHDSVAPAGYTIDWRECNVYGERGWTAAHAAAFNGQKETLLLLLAHGWSCDLPDRGE